MKDREFCDCGPGSIEDGEPTRCICGKPRSVQFWPGPNEWTLPDGRRFMVLHWEPDADIVRIIWITPERKHADVTSADLVGARRLATP